MTLRHIELGAWFILPQLVPPLALRPLAGGIQLTLTFQFPNIESFIMDKTWQPLVTDRPDPTNIIRLYDNIFNTIRFMIDENDPETYDVWLCQDAKTKLYLCWPRNSTLG